VIPRGPSTAASSHLPLLQRCVHSLATFLPAPLSRQIQHHLAPFILRLDVGAALPHQKLDRFQIAVNRRVAQRRHLNPILGLDVGAALVDQKLHNVPVSGPIPQ